MTPGRLPWLAARTFVVVFCWLTAAYALIASSTFAYLQFLRPRVFPWVGTFADWHGRLIWIWLAVLVALVWRDVHGRGAVRSQAIALGVAAASAVAWTSRSPFLPVLANDRWSLMVAVAFLLPPVWLAALDHLRHRDAIANGFAARWDAARLLLACGCTAVALTGIFGSLALVRRQSVFEPDLLAFGLAFGAWRSLVSHGVLCGVLFLVLASWSGVAGARGWRAHLCWSSLLGLAAALAFDRSIGAALTLTGYSRPVAAGLAGAGLVGTWAGVQAARGALRPGHPAGLDLFLGQASAPRRRNSTVGPLGLSAVLAWAFADIAASADWDDLVIRFGVAVVWLVVFGWAYRRTSSLVVGRHPAAAFACLLPLGAFAWSGSSDDGRRALARYATYDPSFRAIDRLLRPSPSTPSFDAYLRAHTGLNDLTVEPVPVDLVPSMAAAPVKPPIFLFIVDSLRPDYLSAYNPSAFFTPNIKAFADESVVFSNTFTRYGGTGLSVPAIWAGSALPHKQYVTPFHPMNALEKLLDVNGYRRFIGLDSIMARLLQPSPLTDELDRGRAVMDYEFCRTLTELETKLAATPRGTPVFGYSLPQDIHMSKMSRWGTPSGDFSGFFAPYAGRIQAFDRCFGRFVDALKRMGLYDESIIVLTSDHGEMLGENGQYGHSYHLFPPVVRVPLIMHLPAWVRPIDRTDPSAIALSTDITPTIYAALGYHPTGHSLLAGRSLLSDADDPARRRGRYVLAASYGAVYAVVSRNGRRLYIADAVKGDDHLFERPSEGVWRERPARPDERAVEQFAIRRHIDETAKAFRLPVRERR